MDATTDSFCLDAESHVEHAIKCLTRHAVNGICWTCICNAENHAKFVKIWKLQLKAFVWMREIMPNMQLNTDML